MTKEQHEAENHEVNKGLVGVVADYTGVSEITPETSALTYRGYTVQELAEYCSFEEVAYLLLEGELPDADQLRQFSVREKNFRGLDRGLIRLVESLPLDCHPMDVLRTAVSYIGAQDPSGYTRDVPHLRQASIELLAKLPTIVALDVRRRRGEDYLAPSVSRGFAENFLYMVFGNVEGSPALEEEDIRIFEQSLILYAEHSFNASAFAARVVTSTRSDLYSAVTGAIGALKGPLHGGANEAVMHTMLEIGDPAKAPVWVDEALDNGEIIIGFGHRVYKTGDSRVPIMESGLRRLAAAHGGEKWVEMYDATVQRMAERTGIRPNVDFSSGPVYHLLGFEVEFFTPIFVTARLAGWAAHIMEQHGNNSLIRPIALYDGPAERRVPRAVAAEAESGKK